MTISVDHPLEPITGFKVLLGALPRGARGIIIRVGNQDFSVQEVQRLMEMGFLEGSLFEVLHVSPFGGDPIAVRVRGSTVALRRSEANAIEVLLHG
jgi:ferrous iron transport protein A